MSRRGHDGGATGGNVFPDEVRLSVSHVIGNAREGMVPDEPESNRGRRCCAGELPTTDTQVRTGGTATRASA